MENSHSGKIILLFSLLTLLCAVSFGGYHFRMTVLRLQTANTQLATTTAELKSSQNENRLLVEANTKLTEDLAQSKIDNANLTQVLTTEQGKNNLFTEQIQAISGTVNTLEKLSKTDKELLRKYSKVYFLSENYTPSALADIATTSLYEKEKPIKIHTKVLPYLSRMLADEERNGTPLQIISGYRSFGDQTALKSNYKVTYGAGANKFSADQGYSEHQLGTTIDLTTVALGADFNEFDQSKAYAWLMQNAQRYGFVLSYPKNNDYYQFEPWHWRFVGVELATKLHSNNQYFYDLDQREIDTYLISIFD
jgi:LAS superfamily LD-carboxypeptidase LdcB